MKKLLFIALNDHVAWGGSEVLWSASAIKIQALGDFEVSALLKRWPIENVNISNLIAKNINVIYKSNPTSKKSFLRKVVDKVLFENKYRSDNDFKNVKEPESYSLAILSIGSHVDMKIIDYCDFLRANSIPYIIVVQLATDLRFCNDKLLTLLQNAYSEARAVAILSEDNRLKIEMTLGCLLPNTVKINNPFNYAQSYLPLKENVTFSLAFVAAFTTFHKGQELLLNALSHPKWKTRSLKINFYGTGTNAKLIGRLIHMYKLEDIIVIKGHVQNKDDIWEANHGLIMTSRMEGQSLAMLEAMSYGRMIISTDVGDASNLIKHGTTGYLINAPRPHSIDAVLEQAWNERDKWLEQGVSAREHLFNIIKKDPVEEFIELVHNICVE